MDITSQRTQAYALIDALPEDCLEIVVSLLRRLIGAVPQAESMDGLARMSGEHAEAVARVRALAGCFSACQTKDWKEDKAAFLQERHQA